VIGRQDFVKEKCEIEKNQVLHSSRRSNDLNVFTKLSNKLTQWKKIKESVTPKEWDVYVSMRQNRPSFQREYEEFLMRTQRDIEEKLEKETRQREEEEKLEKEKEHNMMIIKRVEEKLKRGRLEKAQQFVQQASEKTSEFGKVSSKEKEQKEKPRGRTEEKSPPPRNSRSRSRTRSRSRSRSPRERKRELQEKRAGGAKKQKTEHIIENTENRWTEVWHGTITKASQFLTRLTAFRLEGERIPLKLDAIPESVEVCSKVSLVWVLENLPSSYSVLKFHARKEQYMATYTTFLSYLSEVKGKQRVCVASIHSHLILFFVSPTTELSKTLPHVSFRTNKIYAIACDPQTAPPLKKFHDDLVTGRLLASSSSSLSSSSSSMIPTASSPQQSQPQHQPPQPQHQPQPQFSQHQLQQQLQEHLEIKIGNSSEIEKTRHQLKALISLI